jgi:SAM-dependent methyltransferase
MPLSPTDSTDIFNSYAESYEDALNKGISLSGEGQDFFARGRLKWLLNQLSSRNLSPSSIIDFGCGTGAATPFLREFFPLARIVGCDPSESSLNTARKLHGCAQVEFVLPDKIPTAKPYDLIFCNGVFHHIPPHQRRFALDLISGLLAPKGLFAFFENNPWNPGTQIVMSRIPFDRDAITISPRESKTLLRSAKFTIVEQHFLFFFPRLLSFLRPFERSLLRVPLGAQYVTLACR